MRFVGQRRALLQGRTDVGDADGTRSENKKKKERLDIKSFISFEKLSRIIKTVFDAKFYQEFDLFAFFGDQVIRSRERFT